jgi:penicillin-binding protein 1A
MIIAPLFRDFMAEALKDKPSVPFRVPPGIRLVRVDLKTGQRAQPGDANVILEAFKPGTEPNGQGGVVMGVGVSTPDGGGGASTPAPSSDSNGGLY